MGRLIPAGSGLAGYRNLNIEVDETEDEDHLDHEVESA